MWLSLKPRGTALSGMKGVVQIRRRLRWGGGREGKEEGCRHLIKSRLPLCGKRGRQTSGHQCNRGILLNTWPHIDSISVQYGTIGDLHTSD